MWADFCLTVSNLSVCSRLQSVSKLETMALATLPWKTFKSVLPCMLNFSQLATFWCKACSPVCWNLQTILTSWINYCCHELWHLFTDIIFFSTPFSDLPNIFVSSAAVMVKVQFTSESLWGISYPCTWTQTTGNTCRKYECIPKNRIYRAPVAQLTGHWVVMREVVSSTPARPTLRVLK